jgi:hypothetical protein
VDTFTVFNTTVEKLTVDADRVLSATILFAVNVLFNVLE